MPYITKHGRERIKEKLGKKIPVKIAEKALQHGLKHSDTKAGGSLSKYFDYLYLSHNGAGNNVRIYNEKVFIFSNEVLITVFDLPHSYKEQVRKIIKRK